MFWLDWLLSTRSWGLFRLAMIFSLRVYCIGDLVWFAVEANLFFSCNFCRMVLLPLMFAPKVSCFRLEEADEYGYRPCAVTVFTFCIDMDLPLVL